LGFSGEEVFDIIGLEGLGDADPFPSTLTVRVGDQEFEAILRIDTPKEEEYYRHSGILPYVLRMLHARG
jgi:aconitate hydratase